MGAEQSQEGGEPGPELSAQDLARQAAEKSRAAQGSGRVRKNVGGQVAVAGQADARQALQQGQQLPPKSKWANLFEQAKEDEEREAAGQVVHPGIGPSGAAIGKFNPATRDSRQSVVPQRAPSVDADAGSGEKTSGTKFWEKSGNTYTVRMMANEFESWMLSRARFPGAWLLHASRQLSTHWKNGWQGEFVRNKYHGRGKLSYADGRTCEGDWVQGFLHGKAQHPPPDSFPLVP